MTISIPLVTLPDAGTGQDITGRLPAPGLRLALSRPAVLALVSPTSRGSQPAPPGRPRDRSGLWLRNAAAGLGVLAAAAARAERFGGRTRTFTLSTEVPFLLVLVDELAFLTAYQPERDLRKRAEAAIATLTSQGRSVGVCVVGALQDPRKDVISLRNLFSTRIALRLDESDQVDMVLGDGARDRGALADQISPDPWTGAGVGYVRLEASPDPVRVRAAYVADDDINAMVAAVTGGGW